jgi:hypothetical protein
MFGASKSHNFNIITQWCYNNNFWLKTIGYTELFVALLLLQLLRSYYLAK